MSPSSEESDFATDKYRFLKELGIHELNAGACAGPDDWSDVETRDTLDVVTPIDGSAIAKVALASELDYEHVIQVAQRSFQEWRLTPAPKRGLVVREIGAEIRKFKDPLGKLITLEMGKIIAEGIG
jgi:aldehyde dehydrogenase (NAD+)